MTDPGLALLWIAILGVAVCGALVVRGAGLATTYVRDLLHIGAGVWVVGWPWWSGPEAPVAIAVVGAAAVALVPVLAARMAVARRFHHSVASGDERYAGLVIYGVSFALFTTIGILGDPFPAAAALLALSLGDGIGGAVGRRWGRHHYRTPFGKRKSLEGSTAVAIAAAAGVATAACLFGVHLGAPQLVALGLVAAAAEGVSPRSSDNLLVPASVWLAATGLTI